MNCALMPKSQALHVLRLKRAYSWIRAVVPVRMVLLCGLVMWAEAA